MADWPRQEAFWIAPPVSQGTERDRCAAHQSHLPPLTPRSLHLQPFMYGDYIAYDCWLGKVYDLKNQIILKLSNGARYA